ncbi:MAG TPA: metallophosphoesterase [Luteitalea sp.]|nr:metallophosphoesterase [Luteitalea sp.]
MPLLTSPVTRRVFLGAVGASAASVAFAPAVGAQGAAPRPLRLALLSDTHIPTDASEAYRGFKPVDNLAKVVPQVTASSVEGALLGGDLARLKGLPEDYARLKGLLAPITDKMPVAMVLGNHDHRANFRQAFGSAPGQPEAVANKHTTTREVGGLRFVLLDSLLAPDVTPGQLGLAQREWLSKSLTAMPSTPTVIVVHHTLGGNDGELVDAERLFETLRPHTHVKAIMYGHSHKYEVREREGLQLINLPAVGYNFIDSEPVGWVESVWTAEGVDLTLRAIGGNMAANGQTTSVHWSR